MSLPLHVIRERIRADVDDLRRVEVRDELSQAKKDAIILLENGEGQLDCLEDAEHG